MTWFFVMAVLMDGRLQYSEIGSYETKHECTLEFHRVVEKYRHDGYALEDINGGCYMKERQEVN